MPLRAWLCVLVVFALGCGQMAPWRPLSRRPDPPAVPVAAQPPLAIPERADPPIQLVKNQSPLPPADGKVDAATIRDRFSQSYGQMSSYGMRFRRRELIGNGKPKDELMVGKFRQQPHSVYLKWIGDEAKGREAAYVQGKYGNQIHTILSASDFFLMAGKRLSVDPDSIMVKDQSRYSITEAGFGALLNRYAKCVADGSAKYIGKVKVPEFEQDLDAVQQTMTPGTDTLFPKGGQRTWHFDEATGLPLVVITHDDRGREVEHYVHDRIQFPLQLDDDDFNPDRLWGKR